MSPRRGSRALAPPAPMTGQGRSAARSGYLTFRVADALHPSLLSGPFGAVVDTGFFHLFDAPDRERFARDLAAALIVGGRHYLLGFVFDSPVPNAPRAVRDDELRALFTTERG